MRNQWSKVDALVVFVLNLVLVAPFLGTAYSDQPWNNGYIYMAISRLFRDASWGWNPRQYGGAPFRYLYPPVFHVFTAWLPVHDIGRAFHIATGIGFALIPVGIYYLTRALYENRWAALFTAVAYSICPSPVYLMNTWRGIAAPFHNAPWGFIAIVGYEEAGHAFAFPFALLSLAFAWKGRRLLATVFAAIVFLTNWPAMIGLLMALAALAIAKRSLVAPIAIGGAAYGLSAFWMTPGYFVSSSLLNRIVLRHTLTSAPLSATSWLIFAAAAALAVAAWRFKSLPLAWAAITGAIVVSFTLAGNYLMPSPHRYMLELNAAAVILIGGLFSGLPMKLKPVIAVIAVAISIPFLMNAWKTQRPSIDPKTTVAYKTAQWLNEHAKGSRVLAAGELDSTLPLWSDVANAGGSGQDVSNFMVWAAEREITYGCDARLSKLWLQALGVRYLVIHEGPSREYFHWYADPDRFRDLPVAYSDGAGTTTYELPGLPEAVVVDLAAMKPLTDLDSYVIWAAGRRPAKADTTLAPGEAILLRTNYDDGWQGVSTGRDPLGFLLIKSGRIADLRFGRSWEAWLGVAVTLITIALIAARVNPLAIAAIAVLPAAAAYFALLPRSSPEEQTFIRLQPPMISPGGIVRDSATQATVYVFNPGEHPKVWLGDREAQVIAHSAQTVTFRVPEGTPPSATVQLQNNSCRGNSFTLAPQ